MTVKAAGKGKPKSTSVVNKIWRFFSSLRLALVLMGVLIVLSIIGTFLIQAPAGYSSNPAQYESWLENVAQPQTGAWYPVLRLLGIFNVFHSVWFLGAGALLVLSILVCTFNRWRSIRAAVSLKSPVVNSDYYLSPEHMQIKTPLPPTAAWQKIESVLKRNHYAVREERAEGNAFAFAGKNRFSPMGTYLIHLSLVLFIAAFLIGSYLGFRDPSFTVAEGDTQPVGNGTSLALNLISFTDEYWENGSPKDYRSQVTILDKGRQVEAGIVQVNHPLSYKGIRFYQSFFGDTAKLSIRDREGKSLFKGNVLLSQTVDDYPYSRPAGSLDIAQTDLTVFVVGRVNNDTQLAENQVGIEIYQGNSTRPVVADRLTSGTALKSADLEITYGGKGRFSGFQVSRDPGNGLIWAASALFLIGLVVVFYFPQQQLHFMLQAGPDKTSMIIMRSGAGRKFSSTAELKKIEGLIKKEADITTTKITGETK